MSDYIVIEKGNLGFVRVEECDTLEEAEDFAKDQLRNEDCDEDDISIYKLEKSGYALMDELNEEAEEMEKENDEGN